MPPTTTLPQPGGIDSADVVARLQRCDPTGLEQLYFAFAKGIRHYLSRHFVSQNLEEQFHRTFSLLVLAIQRGDLQEPESLTSFVSSFLRAQVAGPTGSAHLEEKASVQHLAAGMQTALAQLPDRDRHALIRLYVDRDAPQQICHDLELTAAELSALRTIFHQLAQPAQPATPRLVVKRTSA